MQQTEFLASARKPYRVFASPLTGLLGYLHGTGTTTLSLLPFTITVTIVLVATIYR